MSTSGWFGDTLFKISVLMDGMWYYSNFPKLKKKNKLRCAQGKDIGQPMRISVGETISA